MRTISAIIAALMAALVLSFVPLLFMKLMFATALPHRLRDMPNTHLFSAGFLMLLFLPVLLRLRRHVHAPASEPPADT